MYQNIDRQNIHDSMLHFLILESVSYILKKNIENKQKISEIDELGSHLGERIANHLLNNNVSTSNKMEVDDIMKFLGRDVWLFVFGRQISKLQTNRKGTFLIDCDDIKFHHCLIMEKNKIDETLENILSLICGIIKGALGAFNLECSVFAGFKAQPILSTILAASGPSGNVVESKSVIQSRDSLNSTINLNQPQQISQGPFSYSFTVALLNINL
jgi:hypothetical protein